MIANAKKNELIRGPRKAAMLLVMLGEDASAHLVRHLPEDEIALISREMAKLESITPDEAERVLEEFNQMTLAQDYVRKGGLEYAEKILVNAFGQERAKRLVERVVKSFGIGVANLDLIQKADPQQLAKFIHNEHPQTIALILSYLSPSQAAQLLSSLPPDNRADVALRMANLDQISPEIVSRITDIVGQKLQGLGEFNRESYGGVRAVADMCNRLDSAISQEILDEFDRQAPEIAETVRHMMFVFEDLLLVDADGIREVLSKIDRRVLTVALKGTSDELRQHFLQCMSERGKQMLLEDMEAMGPVKIKEVEAAQQEIIALVRQLEAEGVISLSGAVGEQYVV
jgi:flagellar motor switch protein FliG